MNHIYHRFSGKLKLAEILRSVLSEFFVWIGQMGLCSKVLNFFLNSDLPGTRGYK